ncbi:amino acid transporter AVT1H-like isoform X1 [Schistocerca piceifrons]|uniref:amino acid transporter AVT1H-like isoform X1 n=2 Tax=Schistocerca piceifrons TaxID=274613 RepID=UPI001F5EE707|nr:amino acid transporter AVT1H-like isoform X1 [Schistocerca piceifrons]
MREYVRYQATASRDPIWTRVSDDPQREQLSDGNRNRKNTPSEGRYGSTGVSDGAKKGLTVLSTAIFIAGEMAGSGVLALPRAVVDSGWIGPILVIIFCINSAYGGARLGDCWAILEERYPEYRTPVRNPYATIAYRAVGRKTSLLVSGCIQFTLFGAGTVYLLLASQMVQELLEDFVTRVNFCVWFLVICIILTPAMWLESPKDFSIVGVGALLTTAFACVFIFSQIVIEGMDNKYPVLHKPHSFHRFFLAFGTILFSFGGASTFPTIQNDMINKSKFSTSVVVGFSVILMLYFPVALAGYIVYGDLVSANITLSINKSYLIICANILMGIHLILAFLIVINPVCQELEEAFQVPHKYNWKRCLLRSIMMLTMLFIGESIPKFGKILSLVGGSTITLMTFVFPSFFYMKLCDQKSVEWTERYIPIHHRIYMWELILIGVLGGAAATYSAIVDIFGAGSMTKPCYVSWKH